MKAKLLIALLLAVAGCNQRDTQPKGSPGQCAAFAAKLERLYGAEDYKLGKDAGALRAELIGANTRMVLTECRTDPDRVVPCLHRATTVAEIETSCMVPLDDDGLAEAKQFGGTR